MFHLYGPEVSVRNLLLLSNQHLGPAKRLAQSPARALKTAYQGFLRDRQGADTLGNDMEVDFVNDPVVEHALIQRYREDHFESDDNGVNEASIEAAAAKRDPEVRAWQLRALVSAHRALRDDLPDLAGLFDLAINRIFCISVASRGGGSSPHALGVIWAWPSPAFSEWDLVEFYLHELTHNLIFMDDLCHPHFEDSAQLTNPENYARSAIRKTSRPPHLVFHSIAVGVEVLELRRRHSPAPHLSLRMHPPTERLHESCVQSLRSLKEADQRGNLLTARGQDLMQRCEALLQ